jgi:hypothetical protein
MLSWIIQISLISIILIFLVHHLIGFFKTTLTVPKIKDLVNSPSQKYQHMFDTISKGDLNPSKFSYDSSTSSSNSYTAIDLLPTEMQFNAADNSNSNSNSNSNTNSNTSFVLNTSTKDVMKDELKSFLKKQMNTGAINNELSSSPGY